MKNQETQAKILSQIKDGKLYNKKMVLTIEHLFKQNDSKISRNKIKTSISNLSKQGKLLVKDNKIVPFENFFVGTFETKKFGGIVVVQENGKRIEYPVASSDFKKIPHNTVVGFTISSTQEKKFAHIASIVSFNENSLYGNVRQSKKGELLFIPDFNPFDAKFVLEDNDLAKLAIGKKCKVKIKYSTPAKDKFSVEIENEKDIFGPTLSPLANTEAVLREEGVAQEFSAEALKQAAELPLYVSESDIVGRKDYRHLPFITIDPATAQDMDDSIYMEKTINSNGAVEYKYYIAIADITHYVPEGSPLDIEAQNRGFSIYSAGGVTPMFPPILSNNICSLVEKQDRLTVVTEITLDEMGQILDYSFFNGVINSKQKMSYEFVQDFNDGKIVLDPSQEEIKKVLENINEFTKITNELNKEKGKISLSGYGATVILNEDKNDVVDFVNKNTLDSTKLIEVPMVLNNVVVAKIHKQLGIPMLSRVHEAPLSKKFEEFVNYLSFLGIDVGYMSPTNKTYVDISGLIKGLYLEKIISSRLVRSMQKAKYTSSPEASHFALVEDDYTHFTAGIRRYIDVTVHRSLKKVIAIYEKAIENGLLDKNVPMSKNAESFANMLKDQLANLANEEQLSALAVHLNQREERANKIEAKTNAICAALYMQKNLGKTYSAYVSSIEKDYVVATLKDENDIKHSDIIDVIIPIKELIKNKKVFVDTKTFTVNEHQTAKIIYHDGKKLDITISDVDLVEGKIFGKDDYLKKFEFAKDSAKKNHISNKNHYSTINTDYEK